MSNVIFFFSVLGVFNGLLLGAYLLIFSKEKTLPNLLLAGLILSLTTRIGKSIAVYFNPDIHKSIRQLGLSACIFIGPLLYFYLKSILTDTKALPRSWKYIIAFLFLMTIVVGIWRPYHLHLDFWNDYAVYTIYAVWFCGILMAAKLIYPLLLKLIFKPREIQSKETWASIVFLGNAIIATAFFLALFGNSTAYYITGPLVFSLFLYLIAYGFFNQRQFKVELHETKPRYHDKKINSEKATRLLSHLDELIKSQKIYQNRDLKLQTVASMLDITPHVLSQLLNDNMEKSFKSYINENRIEAACRLLLQSDKLSLEGIGYEVGFKSKSTFFTTFKKIKKITPAQFKKQHSLLN